MVTAICSEVAPGGTGATTEVALHELGVARVPLNATVLEPCDDPKFIPLIVTDAPTNPALGDTVLTTGVFKTIKLVPLLDTPDTVTTTFPLVAPLGTGPTIETEFQLAGVADEPLNVIVLDPGVDPKFAPVIVTDEPTTAELGERLVIVGAWANSRFEENADSRVRTASCHLHFMVHTILGFVVLSGSSTPTVNRTLPRHLAQGGR